MNNKNIKKNIKEFNSIKMSDFDNDKIVNSFSTFLDYDQVTQLKRTEQAKENKTHSLGFIYSAVHYIRPANLIALSLVFILAGGGTVFAASESKPKDTLYSVKVNINEKVKTILSNDSSDVDIAIEQINNRYKDAKAVAVSGDVDVKTKNVVNDNLNKHIEFAEKKIEKVKKNNPQVATLLQIELEATIAANVEDIKEVADILNKGEDKELKEIVDEGQKSFEKVSEKNSDLKLDDVEEDYVDKNEVEIEIDSQATEEGITKTLMAESENDNESLKMEIKPQTEYEILFQEKKNAIKDKLQSENQEIFKNKEKQDSDNLENNKDDQITKVQEAVIPRDESIEEFREEVNIDIHSELNPKNDLFEIEDDLDIDLDSRVKLDI